MLSLICPWQCSHRGTETGAACLSCHLKLQTYSGGPCGATFTDLLLKSERLQIARSQKGLAWKALAQPLLTLALLTQRTETGAACLSRHLKLETYLSGSVTGTSGRPASKMRTFAESLQAERASLESCCSASSAHGTARTEAQRLGLLACLATSNFKRIIKGP